MKMLERRIGRRRDATRALTQVPTGWGGLGCPTVTCRSTYTVGREAINPRGVGTESPLQKSFTPNSKKMLTKSGESWSAGDPLVAHPALDHRYSLASFTNPARTGFPSM